tara:strand:- start:441 stop:770 length:330 start_codon:yes stop_codon:yes gene_type:complete
MKGKTMNRKDYIEFVDMLGKFQAMIATDTVKIDEQSQQAIQSYIGFFVSDLCRYFKRGNSKFDEAYFRKELNRIKDSWHKYFIEQVYKEEKQKEYTFINDYKRNQEPIF